MDEPVPITQVPCPACEAHNGCDASGMVITDLFCEYCRGTGWVDKPVRVKFRRESSMPPSMPFDFKKEGS